MKAPQLIIVVILLGAASLLGYRFGQSGAPATSMTSAGDGPCANGAAAEYWVAPMDAAYRRDGPGKSPMGMDLVPYCGDAENNDAADVTISPQVQQQLGVRIASTSFGPLYRDIQALGSVTYDAGRQQMLHARAEGWIETLAVASAGDAVVQDQALFTLFSPKLVSAENEYLNALQAGHASLRQAAHARLLALGYEEKQIDSLRRRGKAAERLQAHAGISGIVAMLGVQEGQFVTPGTHIMTITPLDQVWILVDVLERDAALVHAGQTVTAQAKAWPGREWQGKVDYVYPELDPRTRTLKVRLRFANPDGALKPNMFASIRIRARISDESLSIPKAAVIHGARGDRVVEALGDGAFRISPVRLGQSNAEQVIVLEGLGDNSRVVINGQFLLDSEAQVDAEARRMSPSATPRGETMGLVTAIHADHLELDHAPISPLGEPGLSMGAMRMPFELGPEVNLQGLTIGDRVHVTIENPARGRYLISALHPMPLSNDKLTAGRIVGIDPADRWITLDHAFIENIGMPAMTMGFKLAEHIDAQAFQTGQQIRFAVIEEPDYYLITRMELTDD